MNSRKAFGTQRENAIKDLKIAEGYLAFRAPASLGVADVIAIKKVLYGGWHVGSRVELIEAKCNTGNPYKNFSPSARKRLSEAAKQCGADALLAFWPKHGKLQFIAEKDWP